MNKNSRTKAEQNIQNVENSIRALSSKLFQLAPNPETGVKGAAFISLCSSFNPPAEYESTIGMAFAEAMLGDTAIFSAINDNFSTSVPSSCTIGVDHIVDAFSQYVEERSNTDTHNNYGRGRGSIALYEEMGKKISPEFAEAQQAFDADMEERLEIEGAIAQMLRQRDGYVAELPKLAA